MAPRFQGKPLAGTVPALIGIKTSLRSPISNPGNRSDEVEMLEINPQKVRHLIQEARIFDAQEEVSDPESGSNATDDRMVGVLESSSSNPAYDEMMEFIRSLDEEEQVNLVALAWLGRGTYDVAAWEEAVAEARRAHNRRTAEYLTSLPKLGDYLEEGLSMLEEAGQVDLDDPEAS